MSFGGNLSSGYTSNLIEKAERSAVPKKRLDMDLCKPRVSGSLPNTRYPSMVMFNNECKPPTPAQFALYPKVAVPSSVRTENLSSRVCSRLPDPVNRFSHYTRYEPPIPCPPLPASAAMAGISKPSVMNCNTFKYA